MSDKAGDRFTDKSGKSYELRHDSKGGHLRPYTMKDGESGSSLFAAVAALLCTVGRDTLRAIFSRKR